MCGAFVCLTHYILLYATTTTTTGAEVSSEPMYILLNTAISKQWGFPLECPAGCPCKKYDCNSKKWEDTCGFSEGFCDMMKNSKKQPPEYKIDWVRVYQDPNDENHKVGCSTPERPTRRYIEAHEELYKTVDDLQPLKGIQIGRGPCTPAVVDVVSKDSCGGPTRGRCTEGRVCECLAGWTGPHCMASKGSDPILYDQPDKITDIGFIPPCVKPWGLVIGFCALVFMLLSACCFQDRMDGWTPITKQ